MTVSISSTVETERMTCVKNTVKNGLDSWNFSQQLLLDEAGDIFLMAAHSAISTDENVVLNACAYLLCERKEKQHKKPWEFYGREKRALFVFLMQSQRTLHPFLAFVCFFFSCYFLSSQQLASSFHHRPLSPQQCEVYSSGFPAFSD